MSQDGNVRYNHETGRFEVAPRRKRYYIAGPMTGKPQFNFPEFDAAAASLTAAGYLVTSPAELDDEKTRAAAIESPDGDPKVYAAMTGSTWGDFLSRDVKLIADECDAIVALEGWEYSKGARLEIFVARSCGKPVYDYEEWLHDGVREYLCKDHLIPDDELAEVMEDEVFDEEFEAGSIPIDLTLHPFQTLPILTPVEVQKMKAAAEKHSRRIADLIDTEMADKIRCCMDELVLGGSSPTYDPLARAMHRTAEDDAEEKKTLIDLTDEDFEQMADEAAASMAEGTEGYELKGEVRVTSETGGQKGKKPQAMGLIPPEALLALSEVYGMGAEKYDDHNYLKGYDWSLSFSACLRHLMAAEKGEWLDDESGLPHVMHAAWHCFCLFMFEKHGLGKDDRLSTVVEGVRS